MIILEEAIKLVLEKINGNGILDKNPPYILKEYIIEYKWGWLIPYDSEDHVLNGNIESAYIGNVPVFVDKFDGTTFYCNRFPLHPDTKIENYAMQKYPEKFFSREEEE